MGSTLVRPVLILVALATFLILYAPVLTRLAEDWANDDNYSHGYLIIPLAGYFVWERRHRLASLRIRPSALGLPIVAFGLVMLLAGLLGAELFLPRASLIVVLMGTVVFLMGWQAWRLLALPIAFLLLMIPIPALIFNQIAFPLQLLASSVGETTLSALSIPVLREGNVIVLAHTSLEVAEACSGIRSLVSLLTRLRLLHGSAGRRSHGRRALDDSDRDHRQRRTGRRHGRGGALLRTRSGAGLFSHVLGLDRLCGRLRDALRRGACADPAGAAA